MTQPRVAVLFTGGTISMLPDPVTGAARPALDGAAILARTPGAATIAELVPVDWGLVPASHLSFPQLLDLAGRIRALQADPTIAGVVVVQGTDVIEETAFAWDLLAADGPPVVVTGAMRTAAVPGWDGPENLRAAIRAAASPALRDHGVLVLLDGLLLPADDATKTHTEARDTFRARNTGPLATVRGDRVRIVARRGPRRRIPEPPAAAAEPIALVTVTVATDGAPVRWARAGGARGIVVAATGAGNTHPDVLAAAEEAMASGLPVVLSSRAGAGRVAPAYGFPGGGARWIAAGALPAGSLTGPKARIALALGLGAGMEPEALRALLAGPA
ncbi:MAG: asparaginase [Chloroflexota bacterium]